MPNLVTLPANIIFPRVIALRTPASTSSLPSQIEYEANAVANQDRSIEIKTRNNRILISIVPIHEFIYSKMYQTNSTDY